MAKEAKQRDQALRDAFVRRMSLYRADQLVFLDESGLNTHLAERTHGWGPKGKKIRHQVSGQRSPNISLLPAMTQDGYIACCIFKGSVNQDKFLSFLETDLLQRCNPFPGPRSVIVLDNAPIHQAEVHLHPLVV